MLHKPYDALAFSLYPQRDGKLRFLALRPDDLPAGTSHLHNEIIVVRELWPRRSPADLPDPSLMFHHFAAAFVRGVLRVGWFRRGNRDRDGTLLSRSSIACWSLPFLTQPYTHVIVS